MSYSSPKNIPLLTLFKPSRLLALPMFHAATAPVACVTPLRSGNVTYILRRFELEPFLKYIEKYQVTELPMVPPVCIGIIMSPLSKKYSLKSIRSAACGAAPLDKGPQARLKALLSPDAPFTQVWGMTETSCVATIFYYPEHDVTGSVGRMMPNLDCKLVDNDGNDISAYDTCGELCVRGPTIVNGYFKNPEANARDWDSDGYFHTGDIAYRDGKSKLWYIVDRKKVRSSSLNLILGSSPKAIAHQSSYLLSHRQLTTLPVNQELIKVRGFQVAPPEIEAVLLSHPSIIDAAVIGVRIPHISGEPTELPRAYVVQRPSTPKLSEHEVINYAAKKLAKYKKLDGGVKFVDMAPGIPKTASGKILKRTLREWAAKEVGAKL